MGLTGFQWFQVAFSLVMFFGGMAVWVWGRDRVTSMSGAVADARIEAMKGRIDKIEATVEDAHMLRREMNQDLGHLDKRLTAAEVHIGDHARRIDRLESP